MIRRFAAYVNKVYGLAGALGELRDQRQGPRVSAESCVLFAIGRPPSADTVGYCFERLDPEPLRSSDGRTEFERWELEGFTSWSTASQTVRVVRSQETTRQANEIKTTDWFWVTTLEQSLLPTDDL